MGVERYDAVVVGSGPNGLAGALTLAGAGRSVLVLEAASKPGGGLRTEELLEPGFRHDVCSTIMALVPLSPAFAALGLDLAAPPAPLAHPFDDGSAVLLGRSVDETARCLGADGKAYRRLMAPLTRQARDLLAMITNPPRPPRHPLVLARLGLPGLLPATRLARLAFREKRARALLAGAAAHSLLSLDEAGTAAFALVMLLSAHAGGWPVARGGSGSVAGAMIHKLEELGGRIKCETEVRSIDDLPAHRVALLDVAPPEVVRIAGSRLPAGFKRKLSRFRPGPGIFKLDWTLDRPVPWRASECGRAATVHLGGTMEEIALSETEVAKGRHPERPFVLFTQPTLFDASRAPAGKHIGWAYCHVPNGSDRDMTKEIEHQIERFAPGFRSTVRARKAWSPADLEAIDRNLVGGDIMGGRNDLRQLFARPMLSLNPYATPDPALFICSASTPPGGGVHGMCGVNAARAALKSRLR